MIIDTARMRSMADTSKDSIFSPRYIKFGTARSCGLDASNYCDVEAEARYSLDARVYRQHERNLDHLVWVDGLGSIVPSEAHVARGGWGPQFDVYIGNFKTEFPWFWI